MLRVRMEYAKFVGTTRFATMGPTLLRVARADYLYRDVGGFLNAFDQTVCRAQLSFYAIRAEIGCVEKITRAKHGARTPGDIAAYMDTFAWDSFLVILAYEQILKSAVNAYALSMKELSDVIDILGPLVAEPKEVLGGIGGYFPLPPFCGSKEESKKAA